MKAMQAGMTQVNKLRAIVAGHICLDILPGFEQRGDSGVTGSFGELMAPGKLVNVGAAEFATGGAVANTGLALQRLGIETKLMGKVGEDVFGNAILGLLKKHHPSGGAGMLVDPSIPTSYTVVLNPPGLDRCFLHCPGANDAFGAEDVTADLVQGAGLFHLGYPPLMKQLYQDRGQACAEIFTKVEEAGCLTSLDMALPDPESAAGKVEWLHWLEMVLPRTKVFLPSIDELAYMMKDYLAECRLGCKWQGLGAADGLKTLETLADWILDHGVEVVVIKLGEEGLYLRTGGAAAERFGSVWGHRQALITCRKVTVGGTTGAGDCTIAGFLAGLLRELPPEQCLLTAVGTGAFSVEAVDAFTGVPTWDMLCSRLASEWQAADADLPAEWKADTTVTGLWLGPKDGQR